MKSQANTTGSPEGSRQPALHAMAFVKYFTDHALRTARVVRIFEDDDLNVRPGPGGRTTAELIGHVCILHEQIRSFLEDEKPAADLQPKACDMTTIRNALQALAKSINDVTNAALTIDAKQWDQPIAPMGIPMPRRQLVYHMIEHEVHHCGELYVYVRMVGKVPPELYVPVDESVLVL